MENCVYVCFISASGGSGCTSASRALARILKKIFRKNILVISFDALTEKMAPIDFSNDKDSEFSGILTGEEDPGIALRILKDDFGVNYLYAKTYFNPLHELSDGDVNDFLESVSAIHAFDAVILDVPYQMRGSEFIALCCEKIVIVRGYLPSQMQLSRGFESRIERAAEKLRQRPVLYGFDSSEDRDSFTENDVDIHDQFGAEVRQLADELFSAV